MGKEEDSRGFIPLVKDSSIVVEDRPWFPDDIELVHEKHKRVVRSWQDRDDEISIAVLSTDNSIEPFHDEYYEEKRKFRRRATLLVVGFLFVCMASIGAVFITVRMGFRGRSSDLPPPPSPPTVSNGPPTEKPTQRPTNDLSGAAWATPSPSKVPVMFNDEDSVAAPTISPSRMQSENATPVASPTTDPETKIPVSLTAPPTRVSDAPGGVVLPPTNSPTTKLIDSTSEPTFDVENLPDAGAFSIETIAPSNEMMELSSQPTGAYTIVPTVRPSQRPISEPSSTVTRTCNGLESNCGLRANEVMFATLHNAMSSIEDSFYGPSHAWRLEDALEAGYRGLTLESCDCGEDGIQLCNSFCFSGKRDPVRVFSNIADFLLDNSNEVIVVLIKASDQTLLRLFDVVFAEAPRLRSLMYSHPGVTTEWPLLGELIDLNKRLIIFQDGDLDCTTQYACPEGVHNTFSYMFETPTDLGGINELLDFDLSCTVQRGLNTSDFFILNEYANGASGHADAASAAAANSKSYIRRRLSACREKFGRDPSLLVVDYWSLGAALEMVNLRNSLQANSNRVR